MEKQIIVLLLGIALITSCAAQSPLIQASSKGDVLTAQKLIQEGANINETDSNGATPLMHAVWAENYETTKALLNMGANIDVTDKTGKTALPYAAFYEVPNMIDTLIQAGAKINISDKTGSTPLDYSANNFTTSSELLIKAGAKFGDKSLSIAITNQNEKVIYLILSQNTNMNYQDGEGMTALHHLSLNGTSLKNSGVIADKILQKGADSSIKDKYGYTALRWAFHYNAIEVAAAIRRTAKGQNEAIDDLSFDEVLKMPLQNYPDIENYNVPKKNAKVFNIAAMDRSFLIMRGSKRTALFVGGPVAYGASLAFDKVQYEPKFQACMDKMGFKCLNNCNK